MIQESVGLIGIRKSTESAEAVTAVARHNFEAEIEAMSSI